MNNWAAVRALGKRPSRQEKPIKIGPRSAYPDESNSSKQGKGGGHVYT